MLTEDQFFLCKKPNDKNCIDRVPFLPTCPQTPSPLTAGRFASALVLAHINTEVSTGALVLRVLLPTR